MRINDVVGLMNFDIGPFTIEWFQLQTDTHTTPYLFQIGNGGVGSFSLFISSGDLYMGSYATYDGQNQYRIVRLTNNRIMDAYRNKWTHVAVTRCVNAGTIYVYLNGVRVATQSVPSLVVGQMNNTLYIGNSPTGANGFGGWILFFNIIPGLGIKSQHAMTTCGDNFEDYPAYSPNAASQTLSSTSALGALGILSGQLAQSPSPFSFASTVATVPIVPSLPYRVNRFQTMFTDNARVFYKPGSLAAGGIGTIRNHRAKSRFT